MKLNLDLFKDYEQILVFVQKSNDLDTCCSALSLIKILRKKFPEKNFSIVGFRSHSTFIKEINQFKGSDKSLVVNDRTIAILAEVTSPRQLEEASVKLLEACGAVVKLDHHEFQSDDVDFSDAIKAKIKYELVRTDYSSLCEMIWDLSKAENWDMDIQIAEYLFLGLYSDSMEFKKASLNKRTLEITCEIANYGVNVGLIMREFSKFDLKRISIFCASFLNSIMKGNLLVINLNPQIAYDKDPKLFMKDKNGKLKQKTIFTCVLSFAQKVIRANTYVLIHYSLFDPFNSDKKMIYIVLHRENKALEEILINNGFKLNKNRWSKAMKFYEFELLLKQHLDIFTR